MTTRVSPNEGGYQATCPDCPWLYWSRSLPAVHTEATHHTCTPVLGPRRLAPGTRIVGAGSTAVASRDPRPAATYWGYGLGRESKRPEVW